MYVDFPLIFSLKNFTSLMIFWVMLLKFVFVFLWNIEAYIRILALRRLFHPLNYIYQNRLDLCCSTDFSAKSQWLDRSVFFAHSIIISVQFWVFLSKICLPHGSSTEVQIISILWLHSFEVKPYPLLSWQGRSERIELSNDLFSVLA